MIEIHSELIQARWSAGAFNWMKCPSRESDVKRTRVTSAGNDVATGCGDARVKTDRPRGKLFLSFHKLQKITCFQVYISGLVNSIESHFLESHS